MQKSASACSSHSKTPSPLMQDKVSMKSGSKKRKGKANTCITN